MPYAEKVDDLKPEDRYDNNRMWALAQSIREPWLRELYLGMLYRLEEFEKKFADVNVSHVKQWKCPICGEAVDRVNTESNSDHLFRVLNHLAAHMVTSYLNETGWTIRGLRTLITNLEGLKLHLDGLSQRIHVFSSTEEDVLQDLRDVRDLLEDVLRKMDEASKRLDKLESKL